MDDISPLNDEPLDKGSDALGRLREALKERFKKLATKAHKAPRWLAENLNLILDHHLNEENIQKLSDQALLVFSGSTRRAVSGSAFGVVVSSGLTAGCPLFAVSIGVNTWQMCVSSTNLDRVRKEMNRRRLLFDGSFRKFEEEYLKKKRHHAAVDVVAGCILKAVFIAATLGIIGFSDIADSFVTKFGENLIGFGTEFAGSSATQTLLVNDHVPCLTLPDFPEFSSMFQDHKEFGIQCTTTSLPSESLMAHSAATVGETSLSMVVQPEASVTTQFGPSHDTEFTSSDTNKSIGTGMSELSSAEQLEIEHPTTMMLDQVRNDALAPGSRIGQVLTQHVFDDSAEIGMEAGWADLEELQDKWGLPTSKIIGLVVMIGLVNEVFQPIPHMASIAMEKIVDVWNGGQLSLASNWLTHIVSRSRTQLEK